MLPPAGKQEATPDVSKQRNSAGNCYKIKMKLHKENNQSSEDKFKDIELKQHTKTKTHHQNKIK